MRIDRHWIILLSCISAAAEPDRVTVLSLGYGMGSYGALPTDTTHIPLSEDLQFRSARVYNLGLGVSWEQLYVNAVGTFSDKRGNADLTEVAFAVRYQRASANVGYRLHPYIDLITGATYAKAEIRNEAVSPTFAWPSAIVHEEHGGHLGVIGKFDAIDGVVSLKAAGSLNTLRASYRYPQNSDAAFISHGPGFVAGLGWTGSLSHMTTYTLKADHYVNIYPETSVQFTVGIIGIGLAY